MKLAIVVGTGSEIIKMSPIVKECKKKQISFYVIHAGQQCHYEEDKALFDDLFLQSPEHHLDVGPRADSPQEKELELSLEQLLVKDRPDIVLVSGTSHTTMSAILAADKLGIKIGRIDAGRRSFDNNPIDGAICIEMDRKSIYRFASTETAVKNLTKEGIEDCVFMTGSTIVDLVQEHKKVAESRSEALRNLGLKPRTYILVTINRQENNASKEKLARLFDSLEMVAKETGLSIIFPAHPDTQTKIDEFELRPRGISVLRPFDNIDFLQLEGGARLVITDSGTVQEEACTLKVPCVTILEKTDRPETVQVGANMLSGTEPEQLLIAVWSMMNRKSAWQNPFGDGKAAMNILNLLENYQ